MLYKVHFLPTHYDELVGIALEVQETLKREMYEDILFCSGLNRLKQNIFVLMMFEE